MPTLHKPSNRKEKSGLKGRMTTVILVSGLPRSGKTTVCRLLSSFLNLPVIEMSTAVKKMADTYGFHDLAEFGIWMREKAGDDVFAKEVVKQIKENCIVCGVRSEAEVRTFAQRFHTVLIYVNGRGKQQDKARVKWQNALKLVKKLNTQTLKQRATFIIKNEGELKELKEKVKRLALSLQHHLHGFDGSH